MIGGARWSKAANRNLAQAVAEARRRTHASVEPEHLIWADLTDPDSLTVRSATKPITPNQAREVVDKALESLPRWPPGSAEQLVYSERTKSVLKRALHPPDATAIGGAEWEIVVEAIIADADDPFAASLRNTLGLDPKLSAAARLAGRSLELAGLPAPGGAGDALALYCRDLTDMAAQQRIEPLIGRDTEVQQVVTILAQRIINNPLLLGEPGVGKTAIVEGLALRINGGTAGMLNGKRVLALDLGAMVAGASYRGEFEDRLKRVIDAVVASQGSIILFVDEIHTLMGAGRSGEALDAANLLKPALARGQLRMVGATTFGEYRQYLEKDPAFARRFQRVTVPEPTPEQTVQILAGIRPRFEKHHGVSYSDDCVRRIVDLSHRFIGGGRFPDKAIRVLDRAGARLAVARRPGAAAPESVGEQNLAEVVAELADLPVHRVLRADDELVARAAEAMKRRIVGQGRAVDLIVRRLRLALSPFRPSHRPRAILHLHGPTGTGKTLAARTLAQVLYPGRSQLLEIDMASLSAEHSDAKLIGAPPGYVGYEAGGLLTEHVWRTPYSLVLLEQCEAAHPRILQLFAQLFDRGILRDGQGKEVSFAQCIFLLTSQSSGTPATLAGRIDESIPFAALESARAGDVARQLLANISAGLEVATQFKLSPAAEGALAAAFDPARNAWSVHNEVDHEVMDAVLKSGVPLEGARVKQLLVDYVDGHYIVAG